MDTNQGKFDSIAGAHDDVQVQATAGNQSSQVANIENETGAQNDARAGRYHQGTSLNRWQKIENDAGAQDGVQSKEASSGDLSAQVAKDSE